MGGPHTTLQFISFDILFARRCVTVRLVSYVRAEERREKRRGKENREEERREEKRRRGEALFLT